MMHCKTDQCNQGREDCPTPDQCEDDGIRLGRVFTYIWTMLAGVGFVSAIAIVSALLGYWSVK